jgi:predicted O-methyltransferase YrrM
VKSRTEAILRAEQAQYLSALEPARDPLLRKIEAYASEHGCPISDPEVASFLAITTAGRRPKLVVELGTNIGYGAIVLSRAAGPAAKIVTIELAHDLCAIARGYVEEAGLSAHVEVRQGDALAEIDKIDQPIDLAYVDCVKEEYALYFDKLVPRLSPGAILVADNVLWRGLVAAEGVPHAEKVRVEALRDFNRRVVTDPRVRGVILPLGDGVAYAVKL